MEMSRKLVVKVDDLERPLGVNLRGELFSNINNDELSLSI